MEDNVRYFSVASVCCGYWWKWSRRMGHDKFPNLGSFSKLISDMVLFWNLFLHVVVFYVKSMQIAEAIGDFGQALTRGTGLASVTGDLRCMGLVSLTGELS